ncbi:MAG TPA: ABC transporter substrate-binding protein, partial [Pseudomonas sp.]|nr:ABC transporter substrate-binding protein [Pseudomonas sp.]
YGHMDYGKKDPSLGWRFTDAWFSMAGAGDKGLPNGLPVDEWGIRVEDCHPVGSSVARGGATNGPAAVYATQKYVDWMREYAPREAQGMTFSESGPVPAQGNIAQQIFWYTAFTADMTKPGLPVVNEDGTPKWRMAPSPKGPYWEEGMKLGYQDAGSWTFLNSTPEERRLAAWLYAQFTVAKTVSLKKTLVGLTPIRESDIKSEAMTEAAPKLGGLVEFYRSPARVQWTPTGTNVPDYPR